MALMNQGYSVVDEMINSIDPDIFLCQEHWLTPTNLDKFNNHFTEYFSFGSTAMSNQVELGILRGRPFGGLMTLIKNDLRDLCQTIHSEERLVIVKLANYLLCNVYLPCVGTCDRLLICEDLFESLRSWYASYPNCECVIAGDFNVDLNNCSDDVARYINSFISDCGFYRCDHLTPYHCKPTYINFALNHQSCIDFALSSNTEETSDFAILDPDMNFSDHLPIVVTITCSISSGSKRNANISNKVPPSQSYLRWDKADINSYYDYTRIQLQQVLLKIENALQLGESFSANGIDQIYNDIVSVLTTGAKLCVPTRYKKLLQVLVE